MIPTEEGSGGSILAFFVALFSVLQGTEICLA